MGVAKKRNILLKRGQGFSAPSPPENPGYISCILFCFMQVARHLAKLFDSMAQLKFVLDEEKVPTKEALGMYSKDGEYVDFNKPCMCEGQVCLTIVGLDPSPHVKRRV